jgi:hypothetical protein
MTVNRLTANQPQTRIAAATDVVRRGAGQPLNKWRRFAARKLPDGMQAAARKFQRGLELAAGRFSPPNRHPAVAKTSFQGGPRGVLLLILLFLGAALAEDQRPSDLVARQREGPHVICHRGASEFAHENTLEAYRATFELGGDGNEIDIRQTKDGVLVCFHDDMLDRILPAYGDVADYDWAELQQFRFRNPGPLGEHCRIPTLEEVFELHKKRGGLLHLDIKRPNLDAAIIKLLDEHELWDNVAYCNNETGGAILKHPKYKPCRYKGGLYLDRGEVFPEAIKALLEKPGEGVIVDDPRGVIVALGRKLGHVSSEPVSMRMRPMPARRKVAESDLLKILRDDADWNRVAQSPDEQAESGRRIVARAQAADDAAQLKSPGRELLAALENRVRNRSLHKQWMYQGLDGEKALRTLVLLRADRAVELCRFALWRDDEALEPVVNPQYKNPRSWTDWREKTVVFVALAKLPGKESEELCRDYLALSDEEANKLGPPQFEQAGRALLAISPKVETAGELMKHRLQAVRGRAILDCLTHSKEAWAREALKMHAPHALAYVVE